MLNNTTRFFIENISLNVFTNKFIKNCFYNYKMKSTSSKKNFIYVNNLLNLNFLLNSDSISMFNNLEELILNPISISIDCIKMQELTFLAEYYLITTLFCLILFSLFSFKSVVGEKHFLLKFRFNNQLIFLLLFGLTCYLILVYQQMDMSLLALTSFNDTIYNDQLAFISKLIIGVSSILYLIFITQYLEDQKLSNFEYYIILLTSIIGFFLLCGANDLITAYLAIELQGLAFYVLAAFRKSSNFSIESGVKYFVLGSLSTAIFLLGVTFLYGASGSVVLTDFKDLFVWIFSTNSFFLSFENLNEALKSFQEGLVEDESSNLTELQMISDKFNLLKNKASISLSENLLLKSNDFSSLKELGLYQDISEKIAHCCDTEDLNIENNFWLTYNFLIENFFIDEHLQLGASFQNPELYLGSFDHFKTNLLEACFYENEIENLTNKYNSFQNCDLNFEAQDFYDLNNNIEAAEALISFIKMLDCLMVSTDADINLNEKNLSLVTNGNNSIDYMFSLTNINNISSIFLDSVNLESTDYSLVFDISFVVSGMLLVIFALFFKLALAPFHAWSPDVYEGSPSSSTFFFMIISKFSIFVFLLRLCYSSFYSLISYWQFYSLLIASTSIFIGAIGGLKQRKLKSLLTYSSINNMGFVLLAFSVGGFEGVQIQFYYLIVYIIAGLCIWAIILHLKLKKKMYYEKQNRDLGDLALLQESNNIVAQGLAITLFSMAGIPPMVGFLAKMGVFKALSGVSIYFFSLTNILFSVIATFYYIRIIKILFFENLLVGNLYAAINTKKTFIINFLTFLLIFFFMSPMFLYFYSYKITLFLNKSFY